MDDTSQYYFDLPLRFLVQSGMETAAWGAIALVALTALRRRPGAGLALAGALMAGLASLVFFAEYAEGRLLDSSRVFEFFAVDHPHVDEAITWVRVAGVVLVAAAVVRLLRSPHLGRVPENAP